MNALDIVLIGVLALSMLYSGWRGFIRDLFSILAFVGGMLIALRYYYIGQALIYRWVSHPHFSRILGFALIFLASSLMIWLSGRILRGTVRAIHMSWIDRWAGFLFGLLKGIIIAGIFLIILWGILPSQSKLVQNSRLSPIILKVIKGVSSLFPEGIRSPWDREKDKIDKYRKERGSLKEVSEGTTS